MSRIISLLTSCLCLCVSVAVCAAQGQDLYSGQVEVREQGADERARALPGALAQVLRKLSGLRELPQQPGLQVALDDAASLLLTFQYLEVETADAPTREPRLMLSARFLPNGVDRLVRELALPRWRQERAPVVLWLVVDDGSGRALKPIEYAYAYEQVEATASARGLPVSWAGISEELREQVDLQLLWGGYTDQLLAPGASSDGVVVIAARREGPEWNVRWTYADRDNHLGWRTRGLDLGVALTEGVHQLTDQVAALNAIGPAGPGQWQAELWVSGLNGGGDYARSLAYFQGLSLVEAVAVVRSVPGQVRFRLALNAEPTYLQRAIDTDGVLTRGDKENEYRLGE